MQRHYLIIDLKTPRKLNNLFDVAAHYCAQQYLALERERAARASQPRPKFNTLEEAVAHHLAQHHAKLERERAARASGGNGADNGYYATS